MVIDTSALIAILPGEPEATAFAAAISQDPRRLVSAFSLLEAAVVIEARKGPAGARELDLLLHCAHIDISAMDAHQAELARAAYRKDGKGRHPVGFNLGDCRANALAQSSGEPLLYKGTDFEKTDVRTVEPVAG